MAPTKDALDSLQRNTDRKSNPLGGHRLGGSPTRKKGSKTISQGTAFTQFSSTSFMQMMNSPFKAGIGLIPRDKLIKEFVQVSKETAAMNASRLEQQQKHDEEETKDAKQNRDKSAEQSKPSERRLHD